MSKELNGLNDIVTLVPNEEEFPCKCGQEIWAVEEVWEGRCPTDHIHDLAQGLLGEVTL